MALNLTIDGFAYFEDDSISSSNISYQAYFYKSNAGSSSSTWNTVRVVENTGYYNINLGDGDWLGQDGSASSGDIVIIVFWSPTTVNRLDSCSSLTQWGAFRIVLDGSSTYTNDVQVRTNICPDLSWSLQGTGYVGNTIVATNNSDDTHSWTYGSVTMYQRNSWYTTLMTVNAVNNTDYDWDDGNQDLDFGRGRKWKS